MTSSADFTKFDVSQDAAFLFENSIKASPTYLPDFNNGYYVISINQVPPTSGNLAVNDLSTIGMANAIKCVYIHPNATIALYSGKNLTGSSVYLDGKNQTYYSEPFLTQFNFVGVANSFQMWFDVSLPQWQTDCCKQNITPNSNQQVCGSFWGGGSACNSVLAADGAIVVNGQPNIMTDPNDRAWCIANPSLCDTVKLDFCQSHPSSSFCGCINGASSSAYTAFTSAFPGLASAPRQCVPQGGCTGTDLVSTLVPSSLNPASAQCPNICASIQNLVSQQNSSTIIDSNTQQVANITCPGSGIKVATQGSTATESNSTIVGSNISQVANIKSIPPATIPQAATTTFLINYVLIFVAILVFFLAIILIIYAIDPSIFD